MSILALLFSRTKVPALAQEAFLALAVALAITLVGLHYHHKIFEEGIAAQKAEDQKDIDRLSVENAQIAAESQAKANMAEREYAKSQEDESEYRRTHPSGPVRLCLSTPSQGNSGLPKTSGTNPGDAGTGAAQTNVPAVPDGDRTTGQGTAGPDISGLLELLAVKGDKVSAQLREFQSR